MIVNRLDQHIEAALDHLVALQRHADGQPLLREALEELAIALEELRVLTEELRGQTKELAATRRSLEAEHQRYQDLFELAPDGYVVTDAHGVIEEANSAAAALLRRRRKVLAGKPLIDFVTPDDQAPFRRQLDLFDAGRVDRVQDWELHLHRYGGINIPLVVTVGAVRGPKRRLRGLRWLLRDISERRRAEEALRHSETRTRAIVDTAVDGIITINENGIVELFNPAAERLFGYSADEVVGRSIQMLMPESLRGAHQEQLTQYLSTGERHVIGMNREVLGRHRDGSLFPLELVVSEVFLGDQRLFTGIVRNLTERKRAEAELAELQALAQQRARLADIGAIVAKLTHELGNPLGAVSMQAQLIARRARRDPDQPLRTILKPTEQIVSAIGRLDFLIKDFMSFSREQRLDVHCIELPRFLGELAELWQPMAAERGVRLTVEVPADVPPLEADQEKLRRVLDNLMKNAFEAMDGGGGEIRVRAAVLGPEKVRLSVEDTGSGIPENVQVFRLFETTKSQGTGLGLAIAKEIVRAHGGDIQYARLEPRGTVFHVELPIKCPALQGHAHPADRH